jgi:hypothetical protein
MPRKPEPPAFQTYQRAFAARLREPREMPRPPGASARRMKVYEQLLYNNVESFLLACYPITRKLLGAPAWRKTVRRFLAETRPASPLFRDIPKAFLGWMQAEGHELPFLAEFMHYEWLELAVLISPDDVDEPFDPDGDLLTGMPMLAPAARQACYAYPVHRIGPRFKPDKPDGQRWCYLLYRDADDAVRFVALNPVATHLLERLQQARCSGLEALTDIALELGREPESLLQAGLVLLEGLRREGALLGTRMPL